MLVLDHLQDSVFVESAGTHDYHVGEPPDDRTQRAAAARGYDLTALRARAVRNEDFSDFDYVLAMDRENLAFLQHFYRGKTANDGKAEPRLFLEFAFACQTMDVPDPYYGGTEGFERVLDLVERGASGLLIELKKKLGI